MTDPQITRRELLVRGTGAVVVAGAVGAGGFLLHDPTGGAGVPDPTRNGHRLKNYFADIDFPASNPRISLALGDEARIEHMVRAAVGGLDPSKGMARFISAGDVVLIKPNVGFDRPPQQGATTNPEVLSHVIRLCKQAGARKILVTDNPIESPEVCFAKSKIGPVAQAEGAQVVLPVQAHFASLVVRDGVPDPQKGEVLQQWPVLFDPLDQATKVIGIAPVKDHNLCSASMTLKNWYGLLGGRRNQFHQAIHETISDLGMMMSPTMVIADATRVMMRNGPTGGRLSDVRPGGKLDRPAVVASVDPVACDAWCYRHLRDRESATLAYLDLAHRKISAQIARGMKRLSTPNWQTYDRQGKIITTNV